MIKELNIELNRIKQKLAIYVLSIIWYNYITINYIWEDLADNEIQI